MKKRIILCLLLVIWVLILLFLTFQSGEKSVSESHKISMLIMKIFKIKPTMANVLKVTKISRMFARVVLFMGFGLGFRIVFSLFKNVPMWKANALCVVLDGIVSFETEWLKVFVQGRHCTYAEMLISFIAAIIGTFLVHVFLIVKRYRQNQTDDLVM